MTVTFEYSVRNGPLVYDTQIRHEYVRDPCGIWQTWILHIKAKYWIWYDTICCLFFKYLGIIALENSCFRKDLTRKKRKENVVLATVT